MAIYRLLYFLRFDEYIESTLDPMLIIDEGLLFVLLRTCIVQDVVQITSGYFPYTSKKDTKRAHQPRMIIGIT